MRRLTNLFSANEADQRVLNTPLPRQAKKEITVIVPLGIDFWSKVWYNKGILQETIVYT